MDAHLRTTPPYMYMPEPYQTQFVNAAIKEINIILSSLNVKGDKVKTIASTWIGFRGLMNVGKLDFDSVKNQFIHKILPYL